MILPSEVPLSPPATALGQTDTESLSVFNELLLSTKPPVSKAKKMKICVPSQAVFIQVLPHPYGCQC